MSRYLTIAALVLLTGCAEFGIDRAPDFGSGPAIPTAPDVAARSVESLELEVFYRRVEENLLARGLLRADGGGPDTPFNDEMLARNFMDLAFFEEFSDVGGRIVSRAAPSTLHRWTGPVRVETVFGGAIPAATVRRDQAIIDGFAARLGRATGHPVAAVDRAGNFTVLVAHEQDLPDAGARLMTLLPEVSATEVDFVANLPVETYCVVFASDPGNDGVTTRAVAIVRAELPDALRLSCYHEEIAQGLGLANDSASARPSIFNDDSEFGRLTQQDELLLSILYDPALRPGMTETEARPKVRALARARIAPDA